MRITQALTQKPPTPSVYFSWVTTETICAVLVKGYLGSLDKDSDCLAYRPAQGKNKSEKEWHG